MVKDKGRDHGFFDFLRNKSVTYLTLGSLLFSVGTGIVDQWIDDMENNLFEQTKVVAMETEGYHKGVPEDTEEISSRTDLGSFLNNYSNIYGEFDTEDMYKMYDSVTEYHDVLEDNGGPRKSIDIVMNYFDELSEISDEFDVPLPVPAGIIMIESGGELDKTSYAGHRGIFQLSPLIARHYGLTVNSWNDERTDPVKSAQAGINYLSDLNDRFGQWGLTILGYHQGETRIGNMVADYLEVKHGVDKTGGQIESEVIDKYDVDLYSILENDKVADKYFKSGYGLTGRNYVQKVTTSMDILDNYLEEYDEVEIDDTYEIKRGDTLYRIAEKHNVRADEIIDSNPEIDDPNLLQVGNEIKIPGSYMDVSEIKSKYREAFEN